MIGISVLVIASTIGGSCVNGFCVNDRVVRRRVVQQHQVVQQRVVRRQVVNVVPEVIQTFYFVGAPIRVQSLLEYEKRSDPDYQAFLQFKAYRAGASSRARTAVRPQSRNTGYGSVTQGSRETRPPEPTYEPELTNSVTTLCAKCHGKADPAGDFKLSGREQVPASVITEAIRCIANGEMPKNHQLTREEKSRLLADLLALERTAE